MRHSPRRLGPGEVVERWFAAHAEGDMDAARALLAEDALIRLADGGSVRGFDAFMEWYQQRRDAEGPAFSYEVVDLLVGARHAAAVIFLSNGRTTWRQVAVYEVAAGHITAVHLYED